MGVFVGHHPDVRCVNTGETCEDCGAASCEVCGGCHYCEALGHSYPGWRRREQEDLFAWLEEKKRRRELPTRWLWVRAWIFFLTVLTLGYLTLLFYLHTVTNTLY